MPLPRPFLPIIWLWGVTYIFTTLQTPLAKCNSHFVFLPFPPEKCKFWSPPIFPFKGVVSGEIKKTVLVPFVLWRDCPNQALIQKDDNYSDLCIVDQWSLIFIRHLLIHSQTPSWFIVLWGVLKIGGSQNHPNWNVEWGNRETIGFWSLPFWESPVWMIRLSWKCGTPTDYH